MDRHTKADKVMADHGKGRITLPELVEELALIMAATDCNCLGCLAS